MAANTATLIRSIAQFGDQLSRIIYQYDTIEEPFEEKLSDFLSYLGAAVHALNQLGKLLEDQAAISSEKTPLFSKDGIDYVIVLTEECAATFCRARTVFIQSPHRGRNRLSPHMWETCISVDEQGQRVFKAPALDVIELFRQLTEIRWYSRGMVDAMFDLCYRLEKVHVLLLLVVQVVTVRDLTTKAPSGCVDLKSIVQYHSRIELTAQRANISPRDAGRSRSRSSSLSYSDSDSVCSIRSDRSFRRRRKFRPGPPSPPPPPRRSGPVPFGPPPPGPCFPPAPSFVRPNETGVQIVDVSRELGLPVPHSPPGPIPCEIPLGPGHLSASNPAAQNIPVVTVGQAAPNDIPPCYVEADTNHRVGLNLAEKMSEAASVDSTKTSSELSGTTTTSKTMQAEPVKSAHIEAKEKPAVEKARLLKSPSALGMKVKSLFRSKSSLEAEMKKTLVEDNASLNAYIVHGREYFSVPHSAFHSLEFTHMRTILSQLNDNTWFKTFAELRDAERDAVDMITGKHKNANKWQDNQLVVLKVLHENNLNAWFRAIESLINVEYNFPQHANARIILAIVRSTDCEAPPHIHISEATVSGGYGSKTPSNPDIYPKNRGPPPPPPMLNGDGITIINDCPPPRPGNQNSMGPRGPPPPEPIPSFGKPSVVVPRVPRTDADAKKKLTTYKSIQLRPATLASATSKSNIMEQGAPESLSWTRCTITPGNDALSVIQERIAAFNRRGDSVIDLKMQLTEAQAAQVSRLVEEEKRKEFDFRFEHRIVELSLIDKAKGLVKRQTEKVQVDVIHVTLERTLKVDVGALGVYNSIHCPPIWNPPPRERVEVIDVRRRRVSPARKCRTRRSVSTFSYSSSSSSGTDSDSDSETEVERPQQRWKKWKDPIKIEFEKADRKRDIVELLLEKWTGAAEKKETTEKPEKMGKIHKKNGRKGKNGKRRSKYYSDSD